jgi:hypothetical protein
MEGRLGSQIGLFRRATILKYNDDGTVLIGLDEAGLHQVPQRFTVPIPLSWSGQEGEFIGGYPRRGSSVLVSQGQGGQWFIVSYLTSNNVFGDRTSLTSSSIQNNLMSVLKPGRAVVQVKDGNRLFVDPDLGVQAGSSTNFIHLNPKKNILSHNFNMNLGFTEAGRKVDGIVKRDVFENSNRNVLGSTLDSQAYDEALYPIGLDPTSAVSPTTIGINIRNPPLVERRAMVYEFAQSYGFTTDEDEAARYTDPKNSLVKKLKVNRRDVRADALSLSLEAPNQLIESIQGTVVDTFGNIVDLNQVPLPIGKVDILSLRKNVDKAEAFTRIRSQLRKSIAYHLQINTRHGLLETDTMLPPDVNDLSDYARADSKFTIDVDKEGQFKINVPASSEIGNVPLLVRHTNYSNLLASQDSSVSPNTFVRSSTNQDVFVKSFAGKSAIKLSGSDSDLDGYEAPIDYLTDQPIQYGTAYHDITLTCSEFQESAGYLQAGVKLVDFHPTNHLNKDVIPLKQIVSDTIVVSGPDANAGGRSGMINLDGFIMLNVGANTVDRQSMWYDYAGSMIGNVGRDRQGISWASTFDGDVFWQIGGIGIGNQFDSRFNKENDSFRNGTLDIRVFNNGQLTIFRLGPTGIDLVSPGTMTFSCQQDMVFRTNSSMKFVAENIVMHAEDTGGGRIVNKFPKNTI